MMILGGAVIPPFQGFLADQFGIHQSYAITLVLFGYLAFYAIKARQALKQQGIDLENEKIIVAA
jgi:FHS family L-fucose permease-like MFS transporter